MCITTATSFYFYPVKKTQEFELNLKQNQGLRDNPKKWKIQCHYINPDYSVAKKIATKYDLVPGNDYSWKLVFKSPVKPGGIKIDIA